MLTILLLLLLAIPVAVFAIIDVRRLVFYVLMVAGLPVATFIPGALVLGPFGELGPQAAYLLIITVGLLIAVLPAIKTLGMVVRKVVILFLFLAFAAASVLWSLDVMEGVRFFIKLLTPVLMMAIVAHSLRRESDIARAETLTVVCAGSVAVLAVVNHLTSGALGGGMNYWISGGILTAPYMSPANFSFLMGVGSLICLSRFLASASKTNLMLAAAFGLVVILAFTRIAMAGLVLGGSVIFILMTRNPLLRYAIPAALFAGSLTSLFVSEAIRSRMFFGSQRADLTLAIDHTGDFLSRVNTSGRTHLWDTALTYFDSASPIWGAGLGSSDYWLINFSKANALHSEYLRLYIDTGVVGVGLFVMGAMQVMHFLTRDHGWRRKKLPLINQSAALGAGLLSFYLITLLTDNSLNYVSEFGLYVFSALGYVFAARRIARKETNRSPITTHFGRTDNGELSGNHREDNDRLIAARRRPRV